MRKQGWKQLEKIFNKQKGGLVIPGLHITVKIDQLCSLWNVELSETTKYSKIFIYASVNRKPSFDAVVEAFKELWNSGTISVPYFNLPKESQEILCSEFEKLLDEHTTVNAVQCDSVSGDRIRKYDAIVNGNQIVNYYRV